MLNNYLLIDVRLRDVITFALSISSEIHGGQSRDRTGDTRIFSPVLYQLSYLPFLHITNNISKYLGIL